jgi:hypothetical protein
VEAVAFGVGADGRPLLTFGSGDGTVRLWDPVRGGTVATLLRRTAIAAIAAQNTRLAIADSEGMMVLEVMDGTG